MKLARVMLATVGICVLAMESAPAGVVGYWRFEADGGSGVTNGQTVVTVDDSSGNGRTGTNIGSFTYANTPFTNSIAATGATNLFALNLNAGDNQGVLISGAAATGLLNSNFTLEAFIRMTDQSAVRAVFRTRSGTFPLSFSTANVGGGAFNDLSFSLTDAGINLQPNLDLAVGVNYHVAVTYDGATARMYVNNALVSSTNGTGFTGSSLQSAIGVDPQFPSGYGTAFVGSIDEFRISDVALAPHQFLNIPEPATVSLGILGSLILFGWRKKMR